MAHRKSKRAGKKKSPKRKGKRRGRFTRKSALASMGRCKRCDRPIFGGPKGMATHMRKNHRR